MQASPAKGIGIAALTFASRHAENLDVWAKNLSINRWRSLVKDNCDLYEMKWTIAALDRVAGKIGAKSADESKPGKNNSLAR